MVSNKLFDPKSDANWDRISLQCCRVSRYYFALCIILFVFWFILQANQHPDYKPDEEDYCTPYPGMEYLEGEDGELSWFNAGVRVGVGIGLSICLGVGIGVGLLVRTYQGTTRNFRRRLLWSDLCMSVLRSDIVHYLNIADWVGFETQDRSMTTMWKLPGFLYLNLG